MKVYCVFCKAGLEDVVARDINKLLKTLKQLYQVKSFKKREKRKGKWQEKKQILLPEYVFFKESMK